MLFAPFSFGEKFRGTYVRSRAAPRHGPLQPTAPVDLWDLLDLHDTAADAAWAKLQRHYGRQRLMAVCAGPGPRAAPCW